MSPIHCLISILSTLLAFVFSSVTYASTVATPSVQSNQQSTYYDVLTRPISIACVDAEKRAIVCRNNAPEHQNSSKLTSAGSSSLVTLPETFSLILPNNDSNEIIPSDELNRRSPATSVLDEQWELTQSTKQGTFGLRDYKPNYILPAFYTKNPNEIPTSPNKSNQVNATQNLMDTEAKFQISLKTKIAENLFNDFADIWLGYTQTSRWQAYDTERSRPFRETNYEPEIGIIIPMHYRFSGFNLKLLGVSLNHQSNGRSLPLSRSWNRTIFNVGLERKNWVVLLKYWYRLPDQGPEDDNPDILDYMGNAEAYITHTWNNQDLTLMLRTHLGDTTHGVFVAQQLNWTFPLHRNLRGLLQIMNGYGESLIDYNHRSTYFGIGVTLRNQQ